MRALFLPFVTFATFFSSVFATDFQKPDLKRHMIADLDFIKEIFEVKYAPLAWKREYSHWDLEEAIARAKGEVERMSKPSVKEMRQVLTTFFNSMGDYHVKATFYATEEAFLPFTLKSGTDEKGQKRYFVAHVEQGSNIPLVVGDEVIEFGGKPVKEVVDQLIHEEGARNRLETDEALAIIKVTHREACNGDLVPSGNVSIKWKRAGGSFQATLPWVYIKEKISEIKQTPSLHAMLHQNSPVSASPFASFYEKWMLSPHWFTSMGSSQAGKNKHLLGSKESYLPPLGKKLWKSLVNDPFDAYVFEAPSGSLVGYIRIPSYSGGEVEAEVFEEIISLMQENTEALIIDQLNNPGGSVFYLYALASMLTNTPLKAPKHHISLTQEELFDVHNLLDALRNVNNTKSACEVLGDTWGGYPITYDFACTIRRYCNFILEEWEKGHLLTDPIHLFGIDDIKPHPRANYTKPILFLINELDFSGGDFLPAIMQDNGRAILMGMGTAGAGGYIAKESFHNRLGLDSFILTASLAKRKDLQTPLENLGVSPDIKYSLSCEDLMYNYRAYAKEIVRTIENLILAK